MIWCDPFGSPQPFIGPTVSPAWVRSSPGFHLDQLRFRDPSHFVAGNVHHHSEFWDCMLRDSPREGLISNIIHDGVDVFDFFKHFHGTFQGKHYSSSTPPAMTFKNSHSCNIFSEFITDTILDWVASGAVEVCGVVNEVDPPHLVLPLTVEPTKPRLCHDERFLNLWIKDSPFKLDFITDLPRYVFQGHFQTVIDDKNGYQHVMLSQGSRKYFGFQWNNFYFVFRVLPFGWKASAFIYHTMGLVVSDYTRSFGVPLSQYIDDRHVGQLMVRDNNFMFPPSEEMAASACFIVCYTLINAGYFINLDKSVLTPVTSLRFLGFLSDSVLQAFLIPEDKKAKFIELRDNILGAKSVAIKTLQRFAGKAISFSLALPAFKLYCREIFSAVGKNAKSFKGQVPIVGKLREEILYWIFLDSWVDHLPWMSENHALISLYSDASLSAWGGVVSFGDEKLEVRDYWPHSGEVRSIGLLEALALRHVLFSVQDKLFNCRVDVWVDNLALVTMWSGGGGRVSEINDVIKQIHSLARQKNLDISVKHVPSSHNPADGLSRSLSDSDCMLSAKAWSFLERMFGPHDFDLMSLDSNSQLSRSGSPLPHFSPWPTSQCKGVNFFTQNVLGRGNLYVFPPFILVGPVLRYLASFQERLSVTVVVFDIRPRKYWWPILQALSIGSIRVGTKGDPSTLLFPSKDGFIPRPLQWDLWAFRCLFT